jgi:hypothetical protein
MTNERPIEGHLLEMGFDPARLSDEDRKAIAEVITDALLMGDGWLQRTAERRLQRCDPTTVQIVHNDGSGCGPAS